jgi:CRP/FNR family cyclic AMP-dependent transcriptional regulator
MKEQDLLAEVSIFSHLKKRVLKRIAKGTQLQSFRKGETIVREGERDGRLFIMVSGEAEVVKALGSGNECSLRTLGARSYFGEMALIDDLVRTASVVAKADTQTLVLEQWNLRTEIERNPMMAIELLQMMRQRIQAAEERTIEILTAFLPICAGCTEKLGEVGFWAFPEEHALGALPTEIRKALCEECEKKLKPSSSEDAQ